MRMKKLLMFLVLLTVSVGSWAYVGSGDGITLSDGGSDTQNIVTTKAGALADWYEDLSDEQKTAFRASTRTKLVISGPLNADDLAVLNSSTESAWGHFTTVDMSGVTGITSTEVSSVKFGNATYIRLPNSMTSAEDVKAMASMNTNNPNLKMVGAYDPNNSEFDDSSKKWAKISMHSFAENNVQSFMAAMNIPQTPTFRQIRMSGMYGDKDLNNNGPVLGWNISAEWDFTGAHFADITIPASDAKYYNYNNPFCDPDVLVAPSISSNAFYYFTTSEYMKKAVDLKLPDNNMTHLPKGVLYEMAKTNEDGYKALYGAAAFNANRETGEGVPIETFVIPDCYTDIDEGAAELARIRHLVVGSGMKRIHGGAFLGCLYLEDLDFAAGLSNCYIGDRAFNECRSMKHIALSEGIVSLGNGCFWNSQHLESIRLPQTLKYIGNHAFDNCLALNSIVIPENVEKIGQMAFRLCPFTDIYLMTTDPAKIPEVWSAGTDFNAFDGKCSFHHGHLDGWEGGVDAHADDINNKMTWDEAAAFYFAQWNGMPVLHFPEQLAEKVRSSISSRYALKTKVEDGKQYGLPMRKDLDKRDNIRRADLGSAGQGKYTRDGWAQFMMMKAFTTDPGSEVYQKEYDDVWYTMCFPFDLTDEQLAAAFNETFNIVDFSGVEVMEANDPKNESGDLTLTLHFNTVAQTTYKDVEGNTYTRRMNTDGTPFREEDGNFSYNVYTSDKTGQEYHHVITSSYLSQNKTKTFAPGNSLAEALDHIDEAIIIDGVLAEAGHPYMIHPAIGFNDGGTNKKKCTFAGIDWKPMTKWSELFEQQKREVDLGVQMGTVDYSDQSTWEPDENNYLQAPYPNYAGQTYTFIGNAVQYVPETQEEIGNEPQIPEMPINPENIYDPDGPDSPFTSEDKVEPTQVTPAEPLTADEQTLVDVLIDGVAANAGPWHNETYITDEYDTTPNAQQPSQVAALFSMVYMLAQTNVLAPFGITEFYTNPDNKKIFDTCKAKFNKAKDYENNSEAYDDYLAALEVYNAYLQAKYDYEHQSEAAANWQAYQDAVTAHNNWVNRAKSYQTLIPKGAYFLGRKANQYPKYYRETADDKRAIADRTGGFWTQFTAVIIPNESAINGIERKLGPGIANNTKALNMVFDEGFMGEFNPSEIKDIIAEAEEKGEKVQHMNIVYSINGEVVGHGSQSLNNLPQGMYIINGKKYLVK